jgi:hypothetical protein
VGTFLLGGFGLWLALNGVVAARLMRRPNPSDANLSDSVVLLPRHSA